MKVYLLSRRAQCLVKSGKFQRKQKTCIKQIIAKGATVESVNGLAFLSCKNRDDWQKPEFCC